MNTDWLKYLLLPQFAKLCFKLFGLVLLPYSVFLAIKSGSFKTWLYEIARGWDILANKVYAPAFNKHMVKFGGRKFGQDETISQCMAKNKFIEHADTDTAKWVETNLIEPFDKNHLHKTYLKL